MIHRKLLIYLVGAPGSGKSTLMRQLTGGWIRIPAPDAPIPRVYLLSPVTSSLEAVEMGRCRKEFAGTDALPHSAIETAIPWIRQQTETDLVLGEGARLGNRRFLATAAMSGYQVLLGLLDHSDIAQWRAARDVRLGRAQNPSWVQGRATAARNLADDPPEGVTIISGHPDTLRDHIRTAIRDWRMG